MPKGRPQRTDHSAVQYADVVAGYIGDGKAWIIEEVSGTNEFVCVAFIGPEEVRLAVTCFSPVAISQ